MVEKMLSITIALLMKAIFAYCQLTTLPESDVMSYRDAFLFPPATNREEGQVARQRNDSAWDNNMWIYNILNHYEYFDNCLPLADTTFIEEPYTLYIYEYDSAIYSAVVRKVNCYWNGMKWDTGSIEVQSYYPDGYRKSYYLINGYTDDTLDYRIFTRTFDDAGRPLTYIQEIQFWPNSGFKMYDKYDYQYYPDSTLMGRTYYMFYQGDFVPVSNISGCTYNYYNSPYDYQLNRCYYQEWNDLWETVRRDTIIYDLYGSSIVVTEKYETNWSAESMTSNILNEHGDVMDYKVEHWNGVSWDIYVQYKYFRTYDSNDNLIEVIWQVGTFFNPLHNAYKFVYSDFNDCEPISFMEDVIITESILFSPNPVSDKLIIKEMQGQNCMVVFYDLLGKTAMTFFSKEGPDIDVASLRSGIYIVRLYDSKGKLISTGKIFKT